ncbi:MAG: hypothetical protein ABI605_11860 [Rhizobacter sp.]
MSNALFLPRELFEPAAAAAKPAALEPATKPSRVASFVSGQAVAADLLKGVLPTQTPPATPTERRRRPRAAYAGGVDLFLG